MPKKPKLFIGSSTEGLAFSRQAAAILAADFDVTIWDEPLMDKAVFRFNQNFLSELLRASLQFDFGLLLGTADDSVIVRSTEGVEPRDNVLFEAGLFTGRLGTKKCAFIVDEEIKVLSDFEGIKMIKFNRADPASFEQKVQAVRQFFLQNQQVQVNFLPSSTLASVYFENFLVPVCKYITDKGGFIVNEKNYENCIITVMIPERINLDVNMQFERLKKKYKSKSVSFEYAGRPRSVSIEIKEDATHLEIIDFPTVLSGINYAIQHLLPDDFNERSRDYNDILARELDRFCRVIELLSKQAGFDDLICLKKEKTLLQ